MSVADKWIYIDCPLTNLDPTVGRAYQAYRLQNRPLACGFAQPK